MAKKPKIDPVAIEAVIEAMGQTIHALQTTRLAMLDVLWMFKDAQPRPRPPKHTVEVEPDDLLEVLAILPDTDSGE